MVDLSKILNAVVAGSTAQGGGLNGMLNQLQQAQSQGGLGNILGQLANNPQQQQGSGLGNLLGGLLGGGQQNVQVQQQGGGLGDLLGKLTGPSGVQGQGGLGGLLAQLTQGGQNLPGGIGGLLQQAAETLRNGQMPGGAAGGLAAGGLAAVLLGTETGRAVTGSVAKLGALAAIGGVAYLALKNYQAGKDVVQGTVKDVTSFINGGMPHTNSAQAIAAADQDEGSSAGLLLKAMISAANADGQFDEAEQRAITGQMEAIGLTADEQNYVNDLFANPATVEELAAEAQNDEMKAQVYIAANLAIEVDTAEESRYIQSLAKALGFDRTLKAHLDQAAASAKSAQTA